MPEAGGGLPERSARRYRAALAGMVTASVVAAFIILGLLLWESVTAVDDRRRLEEIARSIDSCVDPSGACAQRGARNTGAAVERIVRAVEDGDHVDPALRDAVLELCDAHDLPCTTLRRR